MFVFIFICLYLSTCLSLSTCLDINTYIYVSTCLAFMSAFLYYRILACLPFCICLFCLTSRNKLEQHTHFFSVTYSIFLFTVLSKTILRNHPPTTFLPPHLLVPIPLPFEAYTFFHPLQNLTPSPLHSPIHHSKPLESHTNMGFYSADTPSLKLYWGHFSSSYITLLSLLRRPVAAQRSDLARSLSRGGSCDGGGSNVEH